MQYFNIISGFTKDFPEEVTFTLRPERCLHPSPVNQRNTHVKQSEQ